MRAGGQLATPSPVRSGRERLRLVLPRSAFARSAGLIAGATAAGQAVALLLTPVLTRLYAPADFGLLGVFMAVVSVLSVLATLRFELAVPVARDTAAVMHLILAGLLANITMAVLLAAMLGGRDGRVAALLGAPGLEGLLWWLLPLTVLAVGLHQLLSSWAVREHHYRLLAQRSFLRSAGQVVAQVGLGAAGAAAGGLLAGSAAGQGAAGLSIVPRFARALSSHLRELTWRMLVVTGWQYRAYPLVSSWAGLVNSAGTVVPLLVLTKLYGAAVAGWFLLTTRIVVAPVALVGDAVAQVYTAHVSALIRSGAVSTRDMYLRTARKLALVGVPLVLCLGLAAPWAFPVVFGEQWAQAGTFTLCLVSMYAAQFVVAPLSQTLNLLQRQGLQLAWDVVRLLAALAALITPWWLGASSTVTVLVYGLTMTTVYGLLFGTTDAVLRRALPTA